VLGKRVPARGKPRVGGRPPASALKPEGPFHISVFATGGGGGEAELAVVGARCGCREYALPGTGRGSGKQEEAVSYTGKAQTGKHRDSLLLRRTCRDRPVSRERRGEERGEVELPVALGKKKKVPAAKEERPLPFQRGLTSMSKPVAAAASF